jgi:hypothetical protein
VRRIIHIALGALSILLMMGSAACLMLLNARDQLRSFAPGSKLEWLDTRIASVDDEFMRRSPALRANFEQFERCMEHEDQCNPQPILAQRDQIIAREWPSLLERLQVDADWKDNRAHREFREELSLYPPAIFDCRPIIGYYKQSGTGITVHTYNGFGHCRPRIRLALPV